MENKKITIDYKHITAIVSILIAIESSEIAIVNSLFKTDDGEVQVGFFIQEESKKLRFRHSDLQIYRPFFDEKSDRYFIILDDGTKIFCY